MKFLLHDHSDDHSVRSPTSSYDGFSEYSGSMGSDTFDFDLFNQSLMAQRQKRVRKPPDGYLCHLCFGKGHYIKDCPEVCAIVGLTSYVSVYCFISYIHDFFTYHNQNDYMSLYAWN